MFRSFRAWRERKQQAKAQQKSLAEEQAYAKKIEEQRKAVTDNFVKDIQEGKEGVTATASRDMTPQEHADLQARQNLQSAGLVDGPQRRGGMDLTK